jgi:hypothetical protein
VNRQRAFGLTWSELAFHQVCCFRATGAGCSITGKMVLPGGKSMKKRDKVEHSSLRVCQIVSGTALPLPSIAADYRLVAEFFPTRKTLGIEC